MGGILGHHRIQQNLRAAKDRAGEVAALDPDPAPQRPDELGAAQIHRDQARLFEELVRIPSQAPAGRDVKGRGLGLSIARRIALAHGGRTGVASEKGRGSTFFMELPAHAE